MLRSLSILLMLMTAGCGGDRPDIWALLYGDVTVADDGSVRGVLVWTFFEPKWERSRSADQYRCGRVADVAGAPDPMCDDCAVAVQLTVEDAEHDCPAGEGSSDALVAMDRLWIQPSGRPPAGDWPDASWQWSLGWSGGAPEVEGVAWDEGMEFGEPPADPSSLYGRRVRLSPTQARAFSTKELANATLQ